MYHDRVESMGNGDVVDTQYRIEYKPPPPPSPAPSYNDYLPRQVVFAAISPMWDATSLAFAFTPSQLKAAHGLITQMRSSDPLAAITQAKLRSAYRSASLPRFP